MSITLLRPLFVDPLANLSLINSFDFKNFRKQACLVAVLIGLVVTCVMVFVNKRISMQELLIAVLLPALILHDIGRFYHIANNDSMRTAKADIFWSVSSVILLVGSVFLNLKSIEMLFFVWAIPTIVTSFNLFRVYDNSILHQYGANWLRDSSHVWRPNYLEFLLGNGLSQSAYFFSIYLVSNQDAVNFRVSTLLISPAVLIQSVLVLNFFSSNIHDHFSDFEHFIRKLFFASVALYPLFVYFMVSINFDLFNLIFGGALSKGILNYLVLLGVITSLNMFNFLAIRNLKKSLKYFLIVKIRLCALITTVGLALFLNFELDLVHVMRFLILYNICIYLYLLSFKLGKS